jgi:hypothetical protein
VINIIPIIIQMTINKIKIFKSICAVVAILAIGGIIFLAFSRHNFARKAESSATVPKGIKVNQELTLPVSIDTAGVTINAAEVYLKFDPTAIKVESVTKDNSIFQLWITDQPQFSNQSGDISFAGGLPTPGFSGKGQIGQVKIRPLKAGQVKIDFDGKSRALLNDGLGTAISLNLPTIKFTVDK